MTSKKEAGSIQQQCPSKRGYLGQSATVESEKYQSKEEAKIPCERGHDKGITSTALKEIELNQQLYLNRFNLNRRWNQINVTRGDENESLRQRRVHELAQILMSMKVSKEETTTLILTPDNGATER